MTETKKTEGQLIIKRESFPKDIQVTANIFFNVEKFEHAQRVARLFADASMVPEHFRKSIGNCLIALNYADRLGADPFMVMQNMYVVQGKPGLEAKLVIALVNNSGRFEPLQFKMIGDVTKPGKDSDGCIAFAKEIKTGMVLEGPLVDWGMVKAEGWYAKNGSKWKTMAPLMFRYRAASYFANIYCPEVKLGMMTADEIDDSHRPQNTQAEAQAEIDEFANTGDIIDIDTPDEDKTEKDELTDEEKAAILAAEAAEAEPKAGTGPGF